MDQQKTGRFLRELRGEKSLTQEQLAEILGVSNRSVSRWENGVTMPDLDLLIQTAELFGVEIGEILDGERKNESMDKEAETLLKIADYSNTEKESFSKRLHWVLLAGLACMAVYIVVNFAGLMEVQPCGAAADAALGMVAGALITGVVITSRYGARLRAAKKRLWRRVTQRGREE